MAREPKKSIPTRFFRPKWLQEALKERAEAKRARRNAKRLRDWGGASDSGQKSAS